MEAKNNIPCCNTPVVSIIIPTRNRAGMLYDTLCSLVPVCKGNEHKVECLVIDNGSTDETASVVQAFMAEAAFTVRYFSAPCPGLHVGRNLGAQLAAGRILAYLDDDVYVQPEWLTGILENFASDPHLEILGGPCLPHWEGMVPDWLDSFKYTLDTGGWWLPVLSLIDYAPTATTVPGDYIFGCNYIILRATVLAAGGFHPDGVPASFLPYRGDGETGMARLVTEKNGNIFYDPRVCVHHRVPKGRLNEGYIRSIYQRNGYTTAYSHVRNSKGRPWLFSIKALLNWLRLFCRSLLRRATGRKQGLLPFEMAQQAAYTIQLIRICFSSELRRWVRQHSYFKEDPCPYWRHDGA